MFCYYGKVNIVVGIRRISTIPVSTGLKCLAYNSVQSVCTSDHKPVWGLFSAALRPGTDVYVYKTIKLTLTLPINRYLNNNNKYTYKI